jgi:hypothetical protein
VSLHSPEVTYYLASIRAYWQSLGTPLSDIASYAYGTLYQRVQVEALMLAFRDTFWILGLLFIGLIPVLAILRKPQPAGQTPSAH